MARACLAALWRGRPQRVIQVCDDSDMKTGDYYDLVADLCGLPRPPRLARADAAEHFSAAQWSFLNESRRLSNERMKRELRLRLRWPTVRECLEAAGGAFSTARAAGGTGTSGAPGTYGTAGLSNTTDTTGTTGATGTKRDPGDPGAAGMESEASRRS